jgi:hypothetical protein
VIETSAVSPNSGDAPAVEAHGRIHKHPHIKADTLVVAVHGVGDQYRKATLQSVVKQFCRACGEPTGIPLGAFHNDHPTYSFDKAQREGTRLSSFAFAEVYWAETAQKVVKDQHTLEGAKAWAETLVERVRMRASGRVVNGKPVCTEADSALATQILREMIETIAVTERLCYLANRAGLFTFDLRRVLDDYLGDVQVVAEFADKRGEILKTFHKTMEVAYAQCEAKAPVVIVAHSEGSVVTLLGLLEAFRQPKHKVPAWAMNVRGLMTIGSPIDKHLYFWPELFDGPPPTTAPMPSEKVAWHNYYDFGDPIGFKLNTARERINKSSPPNGAHAWSEVFDFPCDNDHGFSRYIFPGKAHVDYWTDEGVFGHFLGAVFGNRSDFLRKTHLPPLKSKLWPKLVSRFAPYVGVWALLFVGAFVLFRAALAAMFPDDGPGTRAILQEVAGVSMLLFGVTIAARVPRLTKSLATRVCAAGFAALCMLIYAAMVGEATDAFRLSGWEAGGTYVWMGVGLTIATWLLAVFFPMAGAMPMIATGGLLSAALLIFRLQGHVKGAAWPVVLAFGLYLYFWWLSALLFDLVVVWHIYIRSSLVNDQLSALTSSAHDKTRWVTT